ncbi:ATP-binding cassette domain-containing protein [Thalassobacillus hwangdonensis]|uniref:ATP-binding cassette domain-containing protein n=1 Tax=Thalassobacillus hwangdonensis TaxID=546108 RepID=A0ABW3L516_9BACI
MKVVEAIDLTKKYKRKSALDGMTFTLQEEKITGLIGRNGAGKTTLLKTIAGFFRPTSGTLRVFEETPFNNLKVATNMIYIDDEMDFSSYLTLDEVLNAAGTFYPNWDKELAFRLFDYFGFGPNQFHNALSKGMRSTFNAIVGIAARCPLTIFDEPTTGMDSSVRKDFYRALLKDYLSHPRTIILSSHLLNELEEILEDILVINEGKELLHLSVDEMKEYAIAVSGPTAKVNEWTANREVIATKTITDAHAYVVIKNNLNHQDHENAMIKGIKLTSVTPDDLCTYLTSKTKGGIDDVFNRN